MGILDYLDSQFMLAPEGAQAAFGLAVRRSDAAVAAAPDRAGRVAAKAAALLDAWTLLDAVNDVRALHGRPEDRVHGVATGAGWVLSCGGIEDFKYEGEGVVFGLAAHYRAYGSLQSSRPNWTVAIADLGSAVKVGWRADGDSGWLIEGDEADEPDLPKVTTREGAWARTAIAAARFRARGARYFDAVAETDYDLAERLLLDILTPADMMADDGWLGRPHPFLRGRTPRQVLHEAGGYTRVNALALAERDEPD
jgi:hypothetical protein